ncbi:MAG: HEAT repeat domain-containing protein [Planctomycetota bacterium]
MTKINVRTNIQVTMTIMAILATSLWVSKANGAIEKNNDTPRRDRYLLLDSRIIEDTENAVLTVGTIRKDKRNPLFVEDKPWEPRYDNVYCNVIYDRQDKIYKCWYSPFIIDERTSETPPEKRNPESQNYMKARPNHREMGVCYAVSKDGIHWEKPELGLVEFNGNKKNNILMRGYHFKGVFTGPHGAGVIKDLHEPKGSKMSVAFSPDGLHWDLPIECPQIDAHGDTHNNAFWTPDLGKYIGITRLKYGRPSIRQVAWTQSPDFINWTKAEVVLEGVKPRLQTHDMVVFPTGGVYIGLLGMMDFPNAKSNFHTKQHVELAWSPDSREWHRIQPGTPFIGHSPAKTEVYGKMPYDWGTIFASAPIFLDDEVRIYYGACDWYFFDWRKGYLALATLRPDGWAGYEQIAGDKPAIIATAPVVCMGNMLCLCADVGKKGFVKVTVLDKDNRKLAQSKAIKKTVTDARVKWLDRFSFKNLKGKEIQLRFELKNAKLYSFNFNLSRPPAAWISYSKEGMQKIVDEILAKQRIAQEAYKQKKLIEQARRSQSAEEQFPGYIVQLKDADASARSKAADELAKIALRVTNEKVLLSAIQPLAKAMKDDDTDVRDESAETLGVIASRIKDEAAMRSAVAALVKGLGDAEDEVREECAEALGRIASKAKDKTVLAPAVKTLIEALQDERRATGDFAARALRDIGTSEAKAALKSRK